MGGSKFDIFEEKNGAGDLILNLVSRGNAIITELLRLSTNIPKCKSHNNSNLTKYTFNFFFPFSFPVFVNVPKAYEYIIFDFKYLPNQDLYETRIEDSSVKKTLKTLC